MERDYLDFDLAIEQIDGGKYRARVIDSPAGQTSSEFEVPFSPEGLENFVLKMGRPRARVRRFGTPQTDEAQRFGSELHEALFSADVETCFLRSLDEATRQDRGLRVRLRLHDAPDLGPVPWEFLYSPNLGRFLTLSNQTPLVRYIELPNPVRPLEVEPPLRILTLLSDPTDAPGLDVARERRLLDEATADLVRDGVVELHVLEDTTMSALQHALRREAFHVLHFMGHGGFDERVGDGVLVMEDDAGRAQPVTGHDLGMLLHDSRSLRLAVLNACEGARAGAADPFGGVAQSLIRQGIPAVVAMQFEVTDTAAVRFAHELYLAIADGLPVDAATVEARKGVFAASGDVEWGTPVLYLRAPDGAIFDIAARPARPDVDQLLAEAHRLNDAGDHVAAIGITERVLALEPDHREAEGLAAEIRSARRVDELWDRIGALPERDRTTALRLLEQLLLLDPHHAGAAELLARYSSDAPDPEVDVGVAPGDDPERLRRRVADRELERGRIALDRGEFSEARRAAEAVLAAYPEDPEAKSLLARIAASQPTPVEAPIDVAADVPSPAGPTRLDTTELATTGALGAIGSPTGQLPGEDETLIDGEDDRTGMAPPSDPPIPVPERSTQPFPFDREPGEGPPEGGRAEPRTDVVRRGSMLVGLVAVVALVTVLLFDRGDDPPPSTPPPGTASPSTSVASTSPTILQLDAFDWVGSFPAGHHIAPLLAEAPTIDGRAQDWPGGPSFVSDQVIFGSDTSVRAEWQLGWTETALFVFVDVTDQEVRQRHSGQPAQLFRGDSVSFEYSPSPRRPGQSNPVRDGDLHVLLGPADGVATELAAVNIARDGGFPAGGRESGITIASELTGSGYTLEASIPWGILRPAQPTVGTVVGMNLNVSDTTPDDQLAMMASTNPNRTAQNQPLSGTWFRTVLWDTSGSDPVAIPDVIGQPIATGEEMLAAAGFDVSVIPACSNSMDAGLTRQVFIAGSEPESIVADLGYRVGGLPPSTHLTIKESTGPC